MSDKIETITCRVTGEIVATQPTESARPMWMPCNHMYVLDQNDGTCVCKRCGESAQHGALISEIRTMHFDGIDS